LADIDVTSTSGAQDSIGMVDAAIQQIATIRGELGAFQKNTLESNLTSLRVAQENLTAAESVIRDTDMASEMATFTRNQIMTQSAMAQLAQANVMPQNVMRLINA
jgi:flagellin